ncbi:hypothetical protein BGZ60DRAFT_368780 [Tricladium varicosporioides]|nr:hypothetical protein BGZ60DRAFT_368780 [Hymenoscyphus varicosporioides]
MPETRREIVFVQGTGRLRGRTGCITCRIRRIKCDEAKPNCSRCTSTGRKCDGYKDAPIPRPKRDAAHNERIVRRPSPNIAPQRQVTLPTFDGSQQLQSFEFFVSCTCSVSPMYFGADFWSNRVLQLSLSEPAIRYALCSLSSLHRTIRERDAPRPRSGSSNTTYYKTFSLQQYAIAVKHTQRLLAESSTGNQDAIVKGLVACILFICYENLMRNDRTAQMHLQNGLKILAKSRNSTKQHGPQSGQQSIPADIVRALHRLDVQAMTFSESHAPYPYHNDPGRLSLSDDISTSSYEKIEESMDRLFAIFRWVFYLAAASEPKPIPQQELHHAATALKDWKDKSQMLMEPKSHPQQHSQITSILILKIYHTMVSKLIAVGVYGNETLHDKYILEYSHIVTLGEQLFSMEKEKLKERFFSFEIGIIIPLYYTVTKCRDPLIRRRAHTLLKAMKHQEGPLQSIDAADVAEVVIKVEEDGLECCTRAGQIVEGARVHAVNISVDPDLGHVDLVCILADDFAAGLCRVQEARIFPTRI